MSENQVQREVLPGFVGPFCTERVHSNALKNTQVQDARGKVVSDNQMPEAAQSLATILNSHQSQSLVSLLAACKKAQSLLNDVARPMKGSENMPSLLSQCLATEAECRSAISIAEKGAEK